MTQCLADAYTQLQIAVNWSLLFKIPLINIRQKSDNGQFVLSSATRQNRMRHIAYKFSVILLGHPGNATYINIRL